jgi:hypothetical protein
MQQKTIGTSSTVLPFKFRFISDLAIDQASFALALCPSPLLVKFHGPAMKAHQLFLVGWEQPTEARHLPSYPLLVAV